MRITFLLSIAISFILLLSAPLGASGEGCPTWAKDCFNCGAPPKAQACSKSCTGMDTVCECGYDWCKCTCPWSGTPPQAQPPAAQPKVDKCAGVSCPGGCDGSAYRANGRCDSGSGNCVYDNQGCQYGCSSSGCNSPPAQADKCKGVECPDKCELNSQYPNGMAYSHGSCDKASGQCVYSKSICQNGCDGDACKAPGKCENVKCPDICDGPDKNDEVFARSAGKCNEGSGECEYGKNFECAYTCQNAKCVEDCDNGYDDDMNGLSDCADPACSQSLYCTCQKVGSNAGSGGRRIAILVSGSNFPPSSRSYNYLERDKRILSDAQAIYSKFSSTTPINELGFDMYATRMGSSSAADAYAKCPSGADFTFNIDYTSQSSSYAYYYSMKANLYERTSVSLPNTALHEFGHGFAGLWDEYTYANAGAGASKADMASAVAIGTLMTAKSAWYSQYRYGTNNCAITPDATGCKAYFSKIGVAPDCQLGCTAGAWYRSSKQSVMNEETASDKYNEASQYYLRKRIREIANPAQLPQFPYLGEQPLEG